MIRSIISRAALAAFIFITGSVLSGCRVVDENGESLSPSVRGSFNVDPIFREFYLLLGGETSLGVAISPLVESGSLQIQYTENVLMRYDPQAELSVQYSLAPVGAELGYQDNPLPLPEQPAARVISGFLLYEEFVPLYDALQGSRFTGRPLTQVRLNSEIPRIEQYFENVGFYRGLDEPAGQVHLLAYGARKCGLACRPPRVDASQVAPLSGPPQIFLAGIARTGSDLFGAPLSAPYQAPDGQIEQVYTAAVLAALPEDISSFHLRPAARLSGYPTSAPTVKIDDPRMVFYPVEGDLGYNLPAVFQDYINRHGGPSLAGLPVSELFPEGSLYRQCFENYCLDYDPAAAEAARIRPAPVGERYLQAYAPPPEPPLVTALAAGQPLLTVSAAFELLAPGQVQEIRLQVLEEGSQTPVPGMNASLTVILPDGTKPAYSFPSTGPDGRSAIVLPLYPGTPGQMFLYEVCLTGSDANTPICARGSYLVWEKPGD